MSSVVKGIGKIFKKVGKAIKKVVKSKVFKALVIAAAVLYTGGAAAGYFGAGSTASTVAGALSQIPIVGEAAAGLVTAGTTAGGALASGGISAMAEVVGSQLGLTTLSPETALAANEAAGTVSTAVGPLADGSAAFGGAAGGEAAAGAAGGLADAASATAPAPGAAPGMPDAFGNMPGSPGFDAATSSSASAAPTAAAPATPTAQGALDAAARAGELTTTQGPLASAPAYSGGSGGGIIQRAMDWYSGLKPAGQMVVGQAVGQAGAAALNAFSSRAAQEEQRRIEEERRNRNRVTDLPVLNFGAPAGGAGGGIITNAMRRGGA